MENDEFLATLMQEAEEAANEEENSEEGENVDQFDVGIDDAGLENDDDDDDEIPFKMAILTGCIYSARNLPELADDEQDGRVFFRVLYVESGQSSTMFRCKTTVYKSDLADSLSSPEWMYRREGSRGK